MNDVMITAVGMAVYFPIVFGYMVYGDMMIDKAVDAIEAFFWPVKPEPKNTADMIAMFGEAVDA